MEVQEPISYLGPWCCVPLKAWSLKAGVLIRWSLATVTFLVFMDLKFAARDASAKHSPPLYTTATGCVALRRQKKLNNCNGFQNIFFLYLHIHIALNYYIN